MFIQTIFVHTIRALHYKLNARVNCGAISISLILLYQYVYIECISLSLSHSVRLHPFHHSTCLTLWTTDRTCITQTHTAHSQIDPPRSLLALASISCKHTPPSANIATNRREPVLSSGPTTTTTTSTGFLFVYSLRVCVCSCVRMFIPCANSERPFSSEHAPVTFDINRVVCAEHLKTTSSGQYAAQLS